MATDKRRGAPAGRAPRKSDPIALSAKRPTSATCGVRGERLAEVSVLGDPDIVFRPHLALPITTQRRVELVRYPIRRGLVEP
jgi:hypothetical protein